MSSGTLSYFRACVPLPVPKQIIVPPR